jgi:hypothetical protein
MGAGGVDRMTKIPKSITVTVRNGENFRATRPGKTFPGHGVCAASLRKHKLRHPPLPYLLTYTVTPKGRYFVHGPDGDSSFPWVSWSGTGGYEMLSICFLPESWHGLRVSRKVTPIRGKK